MAVVRPFEIGEVRGHGRQRGRTETDRGAEYAAGFQPKIAIEVAVLDVARAVRSRSGETNAAAS